ncbi:MAG: TolC family protein [Gammaproteobacteria bacterium]|nr:TolC family protein [Gammaproteobacteria bacterium]
MAVRTAPWTGILRRCGWLSAVLAGALSACAGYQPQPLHPRASAQAFAERRLDAPALGRRVAPLLPQPPPSWPPPRWDRATLLAVALVENPELARARAEVAQAAAGEITARQPPNPVLGLQSEYELGGSKSLSDENDRPWLYGISFEIPLRWPLQRRLAERLAGLATDSAHWKLMEATWSVRHALTEALSDWQATKRTIAVLDMLLDAEDRLIATLRRRIDAGEEAVTTLLPLQAQRAADAQSRARTQAQMGDAQSRVAAALGLPPQALDTLRLDWPDWGRPPPLDQVKLAARREQALLSRADLAEAISEYSAAETRLRQAVAHQYPQLNVEPGYYWDHGVHKFPLGFSFTLPIFNQNQGEIAQAHAAREVAGRRMLSVQARIYGQIAGAGRSEVLAREQVDQARRQVGLAQQQVRLTARALQLGADDTVQALAAQIAAKRASLEFLSAQARLQQARNALEGALHMPLSGPESLLPHAALPGASQ